MYVFDKSTLLFFRENTSGSPVQMFQKGNDSIPRSQIQKSTNYGVGTFLTPSTGINLSMENGAVAFAENAGKESSSWQSAVFREAAPGRLPMLQQGALHPYSHWQLWVDSVGQNKQYEHMKLGEDRK